MYFTRWFGRWWCGYSLVFSAGHRVFFPLRLNPKPGVGSFLSWPYGPAAGESPPAAVRQRRARAGVAGCRASPWWAGTPLAMRLYCPYGAGAVHRREVRAAAAGDSCPSVAYHRTHAAPLPEPSLQMVCKQWYRVTEPVFGVPTACMVLCSLMLMPVDGAPSAVNAVEPRVNVGEDGCRWCRRCRRCCC